MIRDRTQFLKTGNSFVNLKRYYYIQNVLQEKLQPNDILAFYGIFTMYSGIRRMTPFINI